MDLRDDITWTILELSQLGEKKIEEGTLITLLRRDLNLDEYHPIFIPTYSCSKEERKHFIHLMQGYIFIASGVPEFMLFNLEKKPYINRVLSTARKGTRILQVISNQEIKKLKKELRVLVTRDLQEGQQVFVKEGMYKGLEGDIVQILKGTAMVIFTFRTLTVLSEIPKVHLEVI